MESAAKTDAKLISRDPDKHKSQTDINRVLNKIGLINHFKLFDASHQRILKKKICINIVETQFFLAYLSERCIYPADGENK